MGSSSSGNSTVSIAAIAIGRQLALSPAQCALSIVGVVINLIAILFPIIPLRFLRTQRTQTGLGSGMKKAFDNDPLGKLQRFKLISAERFQAIGLSQCNVLCKAENIIGIGLFLLNDIIGFSNMMLSIRRGMRFFFDIIIILPGIVLFVAAIFATGFVAAIVGIISIVVSAVNVVTSLAQAIATC